MAKGDQATQDNAGSMQASHAPLNASLGNSAQTANYQPTPIGPSMAGAQTAVAQNSPSVGSMQSFDAPNTVAKLGSDNSGMQSYMAPLAPAFGGIGGSMMGGRFNSGGRMQQMPMQQMPQDNQSYMPMAGPGSATRMTGGGQAIAPTDQNELIRRIMMMSQF